MAARYSPAARKKYYNRQNGLLKIFLIFDSNGLERGALIDKQAVFFSEIWKKTACLSCEGKLTIRPQALEEDPSFSRYYILYSREPNFPWWIAPLWTGE